MMSRSDCSRHQTQVRERLQEEAAVMLTFEEKLARYPFAAARLDAEGRVQQTCHGRREAEAIACARELVGTALPNCSSRVRRQAGQTTSGAFGRTGARRALRTSASTPALAPSPCDGAG